MLKAELLSRAGFTHAFPTRGVPDAELLAALGAAAVVQVRQVHGRRVVEADSAAGAEADAIVARPRPRSRDASPAAQAEPFARVGVRAVGVRVADCAPVLLADPGTGDVAAVHAGWRGVVAGVVPAAVEALGGGGAALLAAIGPCIGPCCFEVGRDVAAQIVASCGEERVVVRAEGEKAYVDLRAAIRAQLRALGVPASHVEDVPGCTKHEAHFYSYRREGPGGGRMLAAIATGAGGGSKMT